MHIETAQPSDIPALCRLLDLLFTQEADFSSDRVAQERGLAQIIADPAVGHILLARGDDGTVIGMVNLLYTVSTALGGRVAILEDMVVDPLARCAGAGSQLLDYAIAFARGQGCRRITLLTDRDNDRAQCFYQRHGFSLSAMIPLRLPLTD